MLTSESRRMATSPQMVGRPFTLGPCKTSKYHSVPPHCPFLPRLRLTSTIPAGRDTPSNPAYYVFNKCNIGAADSSIATKGGSYLGRPWRKYASVVFQQTYISDLISPAGWSQWDASSSLEYTTYKEYKNTGPGGTGPGAGPRAEFTGQLDKKWELRDFLGTDVKTWVDKSYFVSKV